LSASSSTFKLDLGSEDAEGAQDSTVSVLTKGTEVLPKAKKLERTIAEAKNLGVIDMRQISPTVTQLLGTTLQSAKSQKLEATK
jgi:hypothetical protein